MRTKVMLANGVKEAGREETVKVYDIAELVIEAIEQDERAQHSETPTAAHRCAGHDLDLELVATSDPKS